MIIKSGLSRLLARPHARGIILFLLSLACLWITKILLSVFVLSSFSGLHITLEIDQDDQFFAYYSMGGNAIYSERRVASSSEIPANIKTTAVFRLHEKLARKIRIDPGNETGRVKLYHLQITSVFGSPIEMDAAQIFDRFEPNEHISGYELNYDHVAFEINGIDPQLRLKDELIVSNRFVAYVLPVIMALAFYLFISTFRWREFPAFSDLNRDFSSVHINYAALDGIRGIAVLLVLADHTLPTFTGAGTAGVWIFFVLSGFLLTIPFVGRPERAVSISYMRDYMLRRLKRILPMYYVYIFVVFFVAGKYSESAVRHVLFMQGDGHLWTIQQELLFYLVLPLIMAVNYILFRGRAVWVIAVLAVIMLAANLWLDRSVLSLHGVNAPHTLYMGIFVCGMLFSYLYHGVILKHGFTWLSSRQFKFWTSVAGTILLFTFILIVTDLVFKRGTVLAIRHPGWFGVAAGSLILLALLASGRFYSSMLSWQPLRAIGLVGYSFYLIHPVMISLVTGMHDYYLGHGLSLGRRFFIVLLLTYVVSALTYTYIERPFLKRS